MKPRRARDLDAAQPQRLARPERMAVEPDPGRAPGRRRPARGRSTRARSAGTVTLRLVGSPGRAWTGILQASSRAASSVQVRRAVGGKRSNAARSSDARAPCGVCAAASADRSTVRADRRRRCASACRSPARPGSRHRGSAAASATAVDEAPDDAAAAHRRARGRRDRRRSGAAARARRTPAATDSCRRVATRDHARPPARQPARGRDRRDPSARRHDDDPLDGRARRQRVERPGEERPPADLVSQLVDAAHPRRAPGGDHDRVGPAAAGHRPALSRAAAGRRSSGRRRSGGPASPPRRDPCRCAGRRPRRRSSCRRRGSRRPGRLLALLDDPDPQLLAGQDGRLHGVRQRVDVEDADALELGDAVEVEVVRQDRLAPAPGRGRRAWRRPRTRRGRRRRRSRPASTTPSASGRGSRGRAGRGCGGACRSCRRCAGARRARTSGRRACRR